ncbi:sacsin N-terminal ATP-binding-like domain-containing protein [Vibrio natriegens]|uniref:sacsin N-terminal ATP-binding-like domain-containing protein n=1 Tax=Vibrio natriegens TaxID=691 RepID=UPI003F83B5AD
MSEIDIAYQESLIPRIRNLIDGYTTNSILKEYLQNADDSGATELVLTYDRRIHRKLANTRFEFAQGPALIIENNSHFKEKDFESIVNISAEGKREDVNSTGRFGQGFSCSFSVSDDPSFISSGRAYWFDPLKHSVSKGNGNHVKAWSNLEDPLLYDWLKSFIIDGNINFDNRKTIFRLPLRTRQSAAQSQISAEVFSFNDFLSWCKEWKESAKNILFLRNIHKLTLQEITDDGSLIKHLVIETTNANEVELINNSIQADFGKFDSAIEMCEFWLSTNKTLPYRKYIQHLAISKYCHDKKHQIEERESWAVVNGLFNGPNNILIQQAVKALSIKPTGRKVLPWAGAALKLTENGEPVKTQDSKFFSFLPLDISNPFPVCVHGWFDLDSKRTEITFTGGGEVKKILKTWNKLLLKYAVSKAWAMLIDFTKGKSFFSHYFGLWPKRTNNENYNEVITGFYQTIKNLESLYIKSNKGEQWLKPANNQWVFKDFENKNFLNIFSQSFSIIIGNPSKDICKNLNNSGVKIVVLDAQTILKQIENQESLIEYPVEPEHLPYSFINSKSDLLGVIRYLVKEIDLDDLDFSNSPFSLSCDGQVYPPTYPLIAEDDMDLVLIQQNESIVLDNSLIDLNRECHGFLSQYWLEESFGNLLKIIEFYFDDFEFEPAWIESLIQFIANASSAEVQKEIKTIRKLRIAKSEDNQWLALNNGNIASSPLYVDSEDLGNYRFYRELGFNLFDIRFHDKYNPLTRHSGVLLNADAEVIVKHLIANSGINLTDDEALRVFVLERLAKNLTWFDRLSNSKICNLRKIKFVKTDTGHVRSLESGINLYLSSGFNAPTHLSDVENSYEVIVTVNDSEKELFKKFGVTELEPFIYLKDVVFPYLVNKKNIKQAEETIQWIVSEWNNIKKSCDELQLKSIIDELSKINISPRASDGELFRASELYHPDLYRTFPTELQTDSFQVMDLEGINEYSWIIFLEDIGLSKKLLAKHFMRLVISIEAESDINLAISLWNFVISQYDQLEAIKIGASRSLVDELAKSKTLPVEDVKDMFAPQTTWTSLSKANSLITSRDYYLLGLTYFSLHKSVKLDKIEDKEFRKKLENRLGFIKPEPDKVIRNFKALKKVETNKPSELKRVLSFAQRFYSYIGRFKDIYLDSTVRDKSIRLGNMWIAPERVFERKYNITSTYCWNELITQENSAQIIEGLRKLGVSSEPSLELLLELLNEIPKSQTLKDNQLSDAKVILDILQKLVREEDYDLEGLSYILSTENSLENISDVLINDSTNYEKAVSKNHELKFVAVKYKYMAIAASVPSLQRDSFGQLNDDESKEATNLNKELMGRLFKYMSSSSFKDGIKRVYAHEKDGKVELFSGEFIPQKVHLMDTLVIEFFISDDWIYSTDLMTTYKDDDVLYVVNQEEDDLWDSLASYIAESANISDRDNIMLIRRLIKDQRDKESIENFLDSKNITPLVVENDNDYFDDTNIILESWDSQGEIASDNDIQSLFEDESYNIDEIDDESVYGLEPGDTYSDQWRGTIDDYKHNGAEALNTKIDEGKPAKRNVQADNSTIQINPEINVRDNHSNGGTSNRTSVEKKGEIKPPIEPRSTSTGSYEQVENKRKTLKLNELRNPTERAIDPTSKPSDSYKKAAFNHSNGMEKPNSIDENDHQSDIVSPNNRLPVYVSSEKDSEDLTSHKTNTAAKIGDKGEDYVINNQSRFLLSPSNEIKKAPRNNKGYDLIEVSERHDVVRYIEVKTLTGTWSEGGVSLTPSQFNFALETTNWWLFVVENINRENPQVHKFENPVRIVNRFAFDSSWKPLAKSVSSSTISKPLVGDKVKLPNSDDIYEVIKITNRGKIELFVLQTNCPAKKKLSKPFQMNWEVL